MYHEIEKGVINFFEALNNAFLNYELDQVNGIKIFLAGNSSKSPMVAKAFYEHIEMETQKINMLLKKYGKQNGSDNLFELYPPLGTKEAQAIQDRPTETFISDKKITGKTGVAFGLLEVRPGNGIKVIEEVESTAEVKFKFYVGLKKRKKFVAKITPQTEYGQWNQFLPAEQESFDLYYCDLPEAGTGNLLTSDTSVRYKRCIII